MEAWPLRMGQLGYLPLSVQKFMGYNCKKICQQSASETRLKMNQPCLLHKGVQKRQKGPSGKIQNTGTGHIGAGGRNDHVL